MGFASLGLGTIAVLLAVTLMGIAILYWLKPPPQKVLIPSTVIWQKVLLEKRRRSDFWRWLLSLLLALTIGSVLAFSVGRPFWGRSPGGERVVLVIDNSPTMATLGSGGRSRLDRAKEEARAILSRYSDAAGVLVLDTAGEMSSSGFVTPTQAHEQLDGLSLALGAAVGFPNNDFVLNDGSEDAAAVFLISDGVLVKEVPDSVQVVSVFEPTVNVGITAFDLRPLPADASRYQALLELLNSSESPQRALVRIDGAEGHSLQRTVRVAPGERISELLPLDDFVSGPVRCVVRAEEDSFELDDVAYASLPGGAGLDVYLVSRPLPSEDGDVENPFLEAILPLDRRVKVRRVPPEGYSAELRPDLWVFDNFAPSVRPARPALVFRPPSVDWLSAETEFVGEQSVSAQAQDHMLLAHVDLTDVVVERSVRMALASRQLVLGTEATPLVVAEPRSPRAVVLGFSTMDTNLPLLEAFPVFLTNAISWLTDADFQRASLGRNRLPGPGHKVAAADGSPVPTRFVGGQTAFDLVEPGIYQVESGGRRTLLGASLLDSEVSAVNDSALSAPTEQAVSEVVVERESRELFVPFLLLVIALILLEWWTYHRRLTV